MTLETRIHNIKVWFGEYWAWWVTLNLCSFVLLFAYGCEPKTKSLYESGGKITRAELQTELGLLLARAEAGTKDLDRQDKIRNLIFENAIFIAQGGQVNPVGVVTSIMALLGIGATVDDLRLRNERKKQPVLDPVKPR